MANKYHKAHVWIRNYYEKTGICEQCKISTKTDWSNVSGQYLLKRDDWQEYCRKCHARYDKQPHMQGASYKADMQKRNIWQIENVDMATRRKIKTYAVSNGLTITKALTRMIELVLTQQPK